MTLGRITLQDVAEYCGVSQKTVSRVVNGEPGVSEKTMKSVTEAIQKLGFVANAQARSLAGKRSHVFGFIMSYVDSPYASALLNSILVNCNKTGYDLLIQQNQARERETILGLAMSGMVDGLIISEPAYYDAELIHLLDAKGIPQVLIQPNGNVEPMKNVFSIYVTDYKGGFDATEHLVQLGHEKIAIITHDLKLIHFRNRLLGYQEALRIYGKQSRPEYLVEGYHGFRGGYDATLKLMALSDPPTAIFASSDEMALGSMSALFQLGYLIPRDISIIGFDDVKNAAQSCPPLTTVREPIDAIGKYAVNALLEKLKPQGQPQPTADGQSRILETTLVIRETCAPPKKAEN